MNLVEQNNRIRSIITGLISEIQRDQIVQAVSQSRCVSDDGHIDFLMGTMYSASQTIFRNESQLDEKILDEILLGFWMKEGRDIRNEIKELFKV